MSNKLFIFAFILNVLFFLGSLLKGRPTDALIFISFLYQLTILKRLENQKRINFVNGDLSGLKSIDEK